MSSKSRALKNPGLSTSRGSPSLPKSYYSKSERLLIAERIHHQFQTRLIDLLSKRLYSLYTIGSFVTGNISLDRPDLNFLLIFKQYTQPSDFLTLGQICQELEAEFAQSASIRVEFRPFRFILPHYQNNFEISLNPIITSIEEIKNMGNVIFNPWFTQGLKANNKLLFGEDFLKILNPPAVTRELLKRYAPFDLAFFTIPLSRAPAQYTPSQSHLFLAEALINAKNLMYLGVEAALNNKQLASSAYLDYIHHKDRLENFYKHYYGPQAAKLVKKVLTVRENYLKYKHDYNTAKEIFATALELSHLVQEKLFA